jgi:hypothetical protein
MLTVGYGDFFPVTNNGKAANICFIVLGYALFGKLFSDVSEVQMKKRQAKVAAKLMGSGNEAGMSAKQLLMSTDGDGDGKAGAAAFEPQLFLCSELAADLSLMKPPRRMDHKRASTDYRLKWADLKGEASCKLRSAPGGSPANRCRRSSTSS